MKPTVLFISHESGQGIGGSTYSLYNHIKSLEDEITPIVVSSAGDAYDFLVKNGIPCFKTPMRMRLHVMQIGKPKFKCFRRLISTYFLNFFTILFLAVKFRNKVDIIHSNSTAIDIGYWLAKILSVKHVWHIREFLTLDHKLTPLLGNSYLSKLIHSSYKICISKTIAQHYGCGEDSVIYDAIDDEKNIQSIDPKEKYFLFAGGWNENKGIFDLLPVFKEFSKSHPEYALYLTGNFRSFNEQRDSHLLDKNIKILGYRTDLRELMHKASALLMCSKFEALGRVTIEASFAGCAVIGNANGGATAEIIKNGETGWLYKTNEEFFKCLCEVASNEPEVNRRIRNSQSYARENFTRHVYKKKVTMLYRSILES